MIMDDCLRIPEVQRLIYDELDKRTSLSLALTCKAFLEPGLDRIWRNITSFKPLIACIPEELWRLDVLPVPKRGGFNIFMVRVRLVFGSVFYSKFPVTSVGPYSSRPATILTLLRPPDPSVRPLLPHEDENAIRRGPSGPSGGH